MEENIRSIMPILSSAAWQGESVGFASIYLVLKQFLQVSRFMQPPSFKAELQLELGLQEKLHVSSIEQVSIF